MQCHAWRHHAAVNDVIHACSEYKLVYKTSGSSALVLYIVTCTVALVLVLLTIRKILLVTYFLSNLVRIVLLSLSLSTVLLRTYCL